MATSSYSLKSFKLSGSAPKSKAPTVPKITSSGGGSNPFAKFAQANMERSQFPAQAADIAQGLREQFGSVSPGTTLYSGGARTQLNRPFTSIEQRTMSSADNILKSIDFLENEMMTNPDAFKKSYSKATLKNSGIPFTKALGDIPMYGDLKTQRIAQAMAAISNPLLLERSGAAVTDPEMQRFLREFGGFAPSTLKREDFPVMMSQMFNVMRNVMQNARGYTLQGREYEPTIQPFEQQSPQSPQDNLAKIERLKKLYYSK